MEPEEAETTSRRANIAAAVADGKFPADCSVWAAAYAQQSRSDFAVYEIFTNQELAKQCPPLGQIEQCHSLHYLQMACEKIAKAYRFRDTDTPIEKFLTSHTAFSKFMEAFTTTPAVKTLYKNNEGAFQNVRRIARLLSREIELLAPALGGEDKPYNAEYPWAYMMQIIIPCNYSFPSVKMLEEPVGNDFLKIVKIAITNFDKAEKVDNG